MQVGDPIPTDVGVGRDPAVEAQCRPSPLQVEAVAAPGSAARKRDDPLPDRRGELGAAAARRTPAPCSRPCRRSPRRRSSCRRRPRSACTRSRAGPAGRLPRSGSNGVLEVRTARSSAAAGSAATTPSCRRRAGACPSDPSRDQASPGPKSGQVRCGPVTRHRGILSPRR